MYTVFLVCAMFLYTILYAVTVHRFDNKDPDVENGMCRRYRYYRIRTIINLPAGMIGMKVMSRLVIDRVIIPEMFGWIGFAYFTVITLYGTFCICKMILSTEP